MKSIKLNISNREIEFHFGLGFLGELLDSLDVSIEDLMPNLQKNPFKLLPKIMHDSAVYASLRKDEELGLSLYEFTDLIDEDGGVMSDNVAKFVEAFTKSMTKDVPEEKNAKKTKGKKTAVLQK